MTSPSTTIRSSGTSRSGWNEPDRSSSYSSSSRWALTPRNTPGGDRVVAAGDQPAAALVAAAQVEPEGDARGGCDHGVVELDAAVEPALERPALRLVERARGRVDQQRVVGRVQLQVGRAQPGQLTHLVAHDLDDVLQEAVQRGVGVERQLRRPQVGVEAGAGEGDLGDAAGAAAQVGQLLGGDVAAPAQGLAHAQARRPFGGAVADLLIAVPLAPQVRVQRHLAEALDRIRAGRSGRTGGASRRRSRHPARPAPAGPRRRPPPRPRSA